MTSFIKRYPQWAIVLLSIVVVGFYWLAWADDRYVSKATVVLESPQVSSSSEVSFGSLLSGSQTDSDLLLLREYLMSVDMLKKVQEELDFRTHYSQHGDFFARLGDADAPIEELHDYYLKRINVEMDEYSGVLNVEVQAWTPEFAQKFAKLLLDEGERHMNEMGQRLAEDQVEFLDKQVSLLEDNFEKSRQDLLNYQNKNGLISPTQTVESLNTVVSSLEAQLASYKARKSALASYQSGRSTDMVRVESEIQALSKQIDLEKERLARQSGNALNSVSSQYETLQLRADFAKQTYSNALAALENTRIEAARKLKQVSILQSPILPEYPEQPERLYNVTIFGLVMIFLGFIFSMLVMIVKDHRD
ncbi:chain-length determining protein [Cobetia crustatorum]|uniref:Chain-length determining protein n=1 Tax=Cobetia crustatorum TaxID=553385 RepID=A0A558HQC2_9GAMM|nr:chain-length determining protein [Cobetia crustatorum]TVU71288.1 chain-length determining protein [Cobetia crustatorum]